MARSLLILSCVLLLASQSPSQDQGAWVDISTPLVKQLTEAGKKIAWPGQTAGVTVDRTTGDLYMIVPGQGAWKSTDRGATFVRADQGEVGGRCETGYALNVDPAGKRLACFMLDGKCALTLDGGKTWQSMKDVGRNWDFAGVDWSQPQPRSIFAARHESGGEIYLSHDAGASWQMIGKDLKFAATGIFDDKTLVTTKGEGILRSTDGGQTWSKVSDLQAVGRVVVVLKGIGYWLGKDGLLVSRDQGATWNRQGSSMEAGWGPLFGKDEQHIVVVGKQGLLETKDGGATWDVATPLPPLKDVGMRNPGWFLNVGWDPQGEVFYASRMGAPTYKFERKKP
jgi:photosystem II stability/assembly factor-like uncharacterized protein